MTSITAWGVSMLGVRSRSKSSLGTILVYSFVIKIVVVPIPNRMRSSRHLNLEAQVHAVHNGFGAARETKFTPSQLRNALKSFLEALHLFYAIADVGERTILPPPALAIPQTRAISSSCHSGR